MRIREVEVRYKPGKNTSVPVTTPALVYNFMKDAVYGLAREQFYMLGLDNKNRVCVWEMISAGTVSGSLVHPRQVFQAAILCNCSGIILCHNHPSGILDPSQEDKDTTERLQKAGKILGIPIIDHVIVTDDSYYSFKEEGEL